MPRTILVAVRNGDFWHRLYALCNDGSAWLLVYQKENEPPTWHRLPAIPQDE
jgi:hypothetical protein